MIKRRRTLSEPHRKLLKRWEVEASWHWRYAEILQRNGKTRNLRVPCDALMRDLKEIHRHVLAPLDRCEWSFCRKKRGAGAAIRAHARHPYFFHRDIQSFFPSTSTDRVREALDLARFRARDATLLATVCTRDDQLPQGAPTSVALGNLVLLKLDSRIGMLCRANGLTYTRYVDDIAISGGRRLNEWVADAVDRIIAEESWTCGEKGGLMTPRVEHAYLGAIVNGIPRPENSTMARLHDVAHRFFDGDDNVLPELRGLVSWYRSLDHNHGNLFAAAIESVVQARANGA